MAKKNNNILVYGLDNKLIATANAGGSSFTSPSSNTRAKATTTKTNTTKAATTKAASTKTTTKVSTNTKAKSVNLNTGKTSQKALDSMKTNKTSIDTEHARKKRSTLNEYIKAVNTIMNSEDQYSKETQAAQQKKKVTESKLKNTYGYTDETLKKAREDSSRREGQLAINTSINKAKETSKKLPTLSTLASYGYTALEPIEGAINAVSGAVGGDTGYYYRDMRDALRSGAQERLADNKAGQVAYNLATGAGDLGLQVLGSAMTGGNTVPAALNALRTLSEEQALAKERGADTQKATAYGLGAGAIDYALGKKGLDEILGNKTSKNVVKNILRSGAIEGAEEGLQGLATQTLDTVVNREDSQFAELYNNAKKKGMSNSDATKYALGEMGKDDLMQAGMGAILGGAVGGLRGIPSIDNVVANDAKTEAEKPARIRVEKEQQAKPVRIRREKGTIPTLENTTTAAVVNNARKVINNPNATVEEIGAAQQAVANEIAKQTNIVNGLTPNESISNENRAIYGNEYDSNAIFGGEFDEDTVDVGGNQIPIFNQNPQAQPNNVNPNAQPINGNPIPNSNPNVNPNSNPNGNPIPNNPIPSQPNGGGNNGNPTNGNYVPPQLDNGRIGRSKTYDNTLRTSPTNEGFDDATFLFRNPLSKSEYLETSHKESYDAGTKWIADNGGATNAANLILADKSENGLDHARLNALMQLTDAAEQRAMQLDSQGLDSSAAWQMYDQLSRKYVEQGTLHAQTLETMKQWAKDTPSGAKNYAMALLMNKVDKMHFNKKGYAATVDKIADTISQAISSSNSAGEAIQRVNALTSKMESYAPKGVKFGKKNIDKVKTKVIEEIRNANSNTTKTQFAADMAMKVKVDMGGLALTPSQKSQIGNYLGQALNYKTDSRRAKVLRGQAMKLGDSGVPSNFANKTKSFVYDNMLASLKTMYTRNFGGNVAYKAIDTLAKPLMVGADKAVSLATGNRTQGLSSDQFKGAAKGFAKGNKDWWYDVKYDNINTTRSGFDSLEDALDAVSTTFKTNSKNKVVQGLNKALNAYDKVIRKGMEWGDRNIYESTYAARKAELKNVIDQYGSKGLRTSLPDKVKVTDDELIDYIAMNEALESVMQNNSDMKSAAQHAKQALSKASEDIIGVDLVSTLNSPFIEVPGNILSRYFQFTPLGFVGNAVRSGREIARNGQVNQRRLTSELGRNTLGLGLTAAGMALNNAGGISDAYSEDKDEKKAQQNNGYIEYALQNINKDGELVQRDLSDIPVLGAKLKESKILGDATNEDGVSGFLNALPNALEAGLGDTLFQGINRLTGADSSYDTGKSILQNAYDNALSSLGSALIPQIVGQVAKMSDDYKRDLGEYGSTEYAINLAKNRLPGIRQTMPVKVNTGGSPVLEGQGRGTLEKAYETFLAPYNTSYVDRTQPKMNTLADSIKEATGGESKPYLPVLKKSDVTGTKGYNEEEYSDSVLKEMQRKVYATNEVAGEMLSSTNEFKSFSPTEQANMLEELYSGVKAFEKEKLVRKGKTDQQIAEAESKGTIYQNTDKVADALETGGVKGAVEYITKKYTDRASALQNGFVTSNGQANTTRYNKYVEATNGNVDLAADLNRYCMNDQNKLDTAKALDYFARNNVSAKEAGQFFISINGVSSKTQKVLDTFSNDYSKIYEFYTIKNRANTDGKGSYPKTSEVQDYLRTHGYGSGSDADEAYIQQWVNIMCK